MSVVKKTLFAMLLGCAVGAAPVCFAGDSPASVEGVFTANGEQVELQEFFDDTFQYDLKFSTDLSDPYGPIGDPLPAGGGEPGAAFVAWCEAIHAGDIDLIKTLLPAEQAAMLEGEEGIQMFKEDLEFMQVMTPTDVEITGGSSDGATAILEVNGTMEGEVAHGEITMELMDGRWINTNSAW